MVPRRRASQCNQLLPGGDAMHGHRSPPGEGVATGYAALMRRRPPWAYVYTPHRGATYERPSFVITCVCTCIISTMLLPFETQ